jgi:hypothetical protein
LPCQAFVFVLSFRFPDLALPYTMLFGPFGKA